MWNADGSGQPLILRGATAPYLDASFSPDGSRIAAASIDHTVWVWTDLEPLRGVDDPKLWTATTYCLSLDARRRLLGASDEMAAADEAACLRRVDAAWGLAP